MVIVSNANADIYKCVDAQGHVSYANVPRPSCTLLSKNQPLSPAQTSPRSTRPRTQAKKGTPETSEKGDSYGSGFLVGDGTYVVTNAHVAGECSKISVELKEKVVEAKLVGMNQEDDLAVLRVSTLAGTPAPLRRDEPRAGEAVMVAGFPLAGLLSNEINVSTGIVSATDGLRGNKSQLQISAPVQAGNSGGPLLDDLGQVLGVVVGKLNAIRVAAYTGDIPQNINFAIKSTSLGRFLAKHSIPTQFAAKRATEADARGIDSVRLARVATEMTVQVRCVKANSK